ncbi:unnamed protein product [Urochloa humidicola]
MPLSPGDGHDGACGHGVVQEARVVAKEAELAQGGAGVCSMLKEERDLLACSMEAAMAEDSRARDLPASGKTTREEVTTASRTGATRIELHRWGDAAWASKRPAWRSSRRGSRGATAGWKATAAAAPSPSSSRSSPARRHNPLLAASALGAGARFSPSSCAWHGRRLGRGKDGLISMEERDHSCRGVCVFLHLHWLSQLLSGDKQIGTEGVHGYKA